MSVGCAGVTSDRKRSDEKDRARGRARLGRSQEWQG